MLPGLNDRVRIGLCFLQGERRGSLRLVRSRELLESECGTFWPKAGSFILLPLHPAFAGGFKPVDGTIGFATASAVPALRASLFGWGCWHTSNGLWQERGRFLRTRWNLVLVELRIVILGAMFF